jgi:hypothetical protein
MPEGDFSAPHYEGAKIIPPFAKKPYDMFVNFLG